MKSQGVKIQIISGIFEGIGIVGSIILGIAYGSEFDAFWGFAIAIAGILGSIVIGTFLSGFGELVESAFEIKMNVYYMRKSQLEETNLNPNIQQNQMNNFQNF